MAKTRIELASARTRQDGQRLICILLSFPLGLLGHGKLFQERRVAFPFDTVRIFLRLPYPIDGHLTSVTYLPRLLLHLVQNSGSTSETNTEHKKTIKNQSVGCECAPKRGCRQDTDAIPAVGPTATSPQSRKLFATSLSWGDLYTDKDCGNQLCNNQ